MRDLIKSIREEWPVITQAPWTIGLTVLLLSFAVGGVEYWLFEESLSLKNELIQTLKTQLVLAKTANGRTAESPKREPTSTGPATASGQGSIANTGNGNGFSTAPPKDNNKK
jgi:hypothetical protein